MASGERRQHLAPGLTVPHEPVRSMDDPIKVRVDGRRIREAAVPPVNGV